MKKLLLLALTAALLTACSDPKDIKINSMQDLQTNFEKLSKMDEEDKRLVGAYFMRAEGSRIFSHGAVDMYGVTVGEAIEKEKKFQEMKKAELEQQKAKEAEKKAAEEKARQEEEAKAAQLKQAADVVFVDYNLEEGEYSFQSKFHFRVKVFNKSNKAIVGTKGIIVFKDKFGDKMTSVETKIDFSDAGGRLDVGQAYTYLGIFDYNKFKDGDLRMAGTPSSEAKVEYKPETVLFEDGTQLNAQ